MVCHPFNETMVLIHQQKASRESIFVNLIWLCCIYSVSVAGGSLDHLIGEAGCVLKLSYSFWMAWNYLSKVFSWSARVCHYLCRLQSWLVLFRPLYGRRPGGATRAGWMARKDCRRTLSPTDTVGCALKAVQNSITTPKLQSKSYTASDLALMLNSL